MDQLVDDAGTARRIRAGAAKLIAEHAERTASDDPLDGETGWSQRRAVADALVAAQPIEGYDRVGLAYAVVVAHADASDAATRRAAAQLARTLGGPDGAQVLLSACGSSPLVLVPTTPTVSRHELRRLGSCVAHVISPERTAGAYCAAAAVTQVPRAVEEARQMRTVVDRLDYAPATYLLEDVAVEVSLLRSPDVATVLAGRLEPLRASAAQLLDTLRVYLRRVQDRKTVSAELFIHPNTLDYRLRRIRDLTGLSPTAPRDIQTLGAAMFAWDLALGVGG